MQGLIEKRNDTVFLNIIDGSICEKSKTEKEGFEVFETTNPRTKDKIVSYIKRYAGVEALVDSVEWYNHALPDGTVLTGWKLFLDANGTKCSLQLPSESIVASRFMKLAENIDFSQPITIKVWKNSEDKKTAFQVLQNNENVPQAYNKDNLPEPKQRRDGKWDYSDQSDFLIDIMNSNVLPMVEKASLLRGNGVNHSLATNDTPEEEIPF